MTYTEVAFIINGLPDHSKDLFINELAEIGFETFEDGSEGFNAYISTAGFSESLLIEIVSRYSSKDNISYKITKIPHQNWNELWESNFGPISIGQKCHVRATFHRAQPDFTYEIVIDPKMAFGTGHHQTTSLVMEMMLEEDFREKKVLDMGCGTAILGILARKMGADTVVAIDNDDVCYHSAIENSALNSCSDIKVYCGSKEAIPDMYFDYVIANINRNILIDQMERYVPVLEKGGSLIMSGFYEEPDLSIIRDRAEQLGLKYSDHRSKENWTAAHFKAM